MKYKRALLRMAVDSGNWRHPRPSADPRLLSVALGISYVSFVQTFVFRPAETISAKAYTDPSAIAVAAVVFLSAILLYRAAFCKNQISSWGYEIGACMGFAGQAGIQFWASTEVNDQWWASSTIAWSLFWGIGNVIRAVILIRRVV